MHVCKTLSQPDTNGLQTCLEWTSFGLFSLTPAEAAYLSSYIILSFVAVFCFKQVGNLIKKFT